MEAIRPTKVNDALFVSSSVPEDDFPVWLPATTYAVGDKRIKAHRIWQSVQATNIGHDPETSGVSWWADQGPTNCWAMLDGKVGTVTSASGSITLVLAPGRIDSMALFQVDAAEVTVTMTVGSDIVYSKTISMIDSAVITSWKQYFFEKIRPRSDCVLTDLPIFGEATVSITLSRSSGTVSCGMLVVGLLADLGETLAGAKIGINDFSKVTDDGFGGLDLITGAWAKKAEVKLVLDSSEVDRIDYILADFRATPVVWIGARNLYQCLIIYGKYDSFDIDIPYHNLSYCTLSIRGII